MSAAILTNIRLGFACNSSSTHGIIYLDDEETVIDGEFKVHDEYAAFVASTLAEKVAYIVATIVGKLPKAKVYHILEELLGIKLPRWKGEVYDGSLSSVFDPVHDWTYYKELLPRLISDNKVRITNEYAKVNGGFSDIGSGWTSNFRIRVDDVYGYMTVINTQSGAKIRIKEGHFKQNVPLPELLKTGADVERASVPELVDLKITDYCDLGCRFCYQGSTKRGKHASYESIVRIANTLAAAKVFEVALGGGEPTKHPEINSIVSLFREKNITVNMTTRNPKMARSLCNSAGLSAFAISVNSITEFRRHVSSVPKKLYFDPLYGASFQLIDGLLSPRRLYALLSVIYNTVEEAKVVYLGFKSTGRGAIIKPINSKWVETFKSIEVAQRLLNPGKQLWFGVDTALVRQYPEALKEVPSVLYNATEGKFSMYIDAVNGTCGASSYEKQMPFPREIISDDIGTSVTALKQVFCRM